MSERNEWEDQTFDHRWSRRRGLLRTKTMVVSRGGHATRQQIKMGADCIKINVCGADHPDRHTPETPFWQEMTFEEIFRLNFDEPPPGFKVSDSNEEIVKFEEIPDSSLAHMTAFLTELVARGVDAVFIPVEVDAPSDTDVAGAASGIVHRCPFLQAGAYVVPPGIVRVPPYRAHL